MVMAPGAVERLIVPVSFDVDWVHCRTNVPVYAPPYVPFQLPDSTGPFTGRGDLVGLVGAVTLAGGADVTPAAGEVDDWAGRAGVEEVEDVVLLDEHPATSAAVVPTAKISFVRFMVIIPVAREIGCRRLWSRGGDARYIGAGRGTGPLLRLRGAEARPGWTARAGSRVTIGA
jgi:hypothetical protein